MKYIYSYNNHSSTSKNDIHKANSKSDCDKSDAKKITEKKYIRNNYKTALVIFKFIIYNLLFPLYLTNRNILAPRKLANSGQIITIEIFGMGLLNHISNDFDKKPKTIYLKTKNLTNYYPKCINYTANTTRTVTLEFSISTFWGRISLENLFANLPHIKTVDLSKFTDEVKNMRNMFKNCKGLEYVNFGNFDTSHVTTMENMFFGTNLQFLDLSKFDTSSVSNMDNMFSESKNLLYLNLNNFNTIKVDNMNKMFKNCKSLMYLNIYSFKENSKLKYTDIFSGTKEDLIYCVNAGTAPNIAKKLEDKTTVNACDNECFNAPKKLIPEKNICLNECSEDDTYICEYHNLCYNHSLEDTDVVQISEEIGDIKIEEASEIVTEETTEKVTEETTEKVTEKNTEGKKDEIMDNCSTEDFFKGKCQSSNQTLSTEKKDNMINNIVDNIISGNLNDLLDDIASGETKDFYIKEDDVIFQITTTENQDNDEYNNVSTIHLGKCEDILKQRYGIDPNASLIILKIDYFMEGLQIPIIGYEVFHPEDKSKLDLDYCKDILINYNIPVSINEDEISKYDPNSEYYNDECSLSTSGDGTDMTLSDRQREYNENNMSLCESKCNFTEYNVDSKKSVCMCEIKSKIYSISEILDSKETVSKDFNVDNTTTSSSSSLSLMKCYNALFSKYGLLTNMGNYILLLMIICFSISSIFFYKVGYTLLCNDIIQILSTKEQNEQKLNIYNSELNNMNKSIKKKKKKKMRRASIRPANPVRKSIKGKIETIDSINTGKDINVYKSFSKLDFKQKPNNEASKVISPSIEEKSKENQNLPIQYYDFELNNFSYKVALEKDKRPFIEYYISLIRAKHPIIFTFIPIKDYNSMITKLGIFLISFGVVYAINALFFNESTIHQIYKDKGAYNFGYFLPYTMASFIIAHIIVIILKYVFLSERNIIEIKNQETRSKAGEIVDNVKRCLIIKYIVFYAAGILFLILFWYYLSSICAVYQNSQVFLLINTFISSFLSLLYPFCINLIPTAIRIFSLNDNSREIFYKISKIIQII